MVKFIQSGDVIYLVYQSNKIATIDKSDSLKDKSAQELLDSIQ